MSLAARYAALVVRARVAVVATWALLAVLAVATLPTLGEAQSGALGDLVPADAEAIDAERRSAELFGFPLLARTVVVQRDPAGMSRPAQAAALERALALNRGALPGLTGIAGALPVTNGVDGVAFAREDGTSVLTFLLYPPDIGPVGRTGLAELLARRHMSEPRDALVGVTGAIPARTEQRRQIEDALPLVELLTLLVVTVAVGVHFRALLAPLINIAGIALAYLVGTRVTAVIGQAAGISVPSEVRPVIVVLLFGVLTDYAIFFLSRMRRHLADGEDRLAAARRTTEDMTGIVLTAGLAVAGASAALIAADLGFLRAFGPGMAISVLFGLAVALTFIPAALALTGAGVFWPSRPRAHDAALAAAAHHERAVPQAPRRTRSRAIRLAATRPGLTIAVCLIALGAAGANAFRLDPAQTLIRGLPADTEPRIAYQAAAEAFAPGILSPTVVVLEAPGIAARKAALVRLQEALELRGSIAAVLGPREQRFERPFGAVYGNDGDAVRMVVVIDSDPLGAIAIRAVRRLRDGLPIHLDQAGLAGVRASIAGDTALAEETVTKTRSDLARVAPAALLVVLAILAVFLRALVAPLYLVAASLVAVAAALGLTVLVFQDLLGYGEITFHVPFAAAVLLLALGSDYNVFIAGRIWAEAKTRPLREAVLEGGSRAATPITVAGLVLAASFALLALVPIRPFRELAFVMSVGLLLDAFVVRTLLVPALIAATGTASSWPRRWRTPRARRAGDAPSG